MAKARQVERCRARWRRPSHVPIDPRQILGAPTDGMDSFVELTETMAVLRQMVHTHQSVYQDSMRAAIEGQLSAFLGLVEWSSEDSRKNRQKLKRRRSQLQVA